MTKRLEVKKIFITLFCMCSISIWAQGPQDTKTINKAKPARSAGIAAIEDFFGHDRENILKECSVKMNIDERYLIVKKGGHQERFNFSDRGVAISGTSEPGSFALTLSTNNFATTRVLRKHAYARRAMNLAPSEEANEITGLILVKDHELMHVQLFRSDIGTPYVCMAEIN